MVSSWDDEVRENPKPFSSVHAILGTTIDTCIESMVEKGIKRGAAEAALTDIVLGLLLGRICSITRNSTSTPEDMIDLSHGVLASKLSEICKICKETKS